MATALIAAFLTGVVIAAIICGCMVIQYYLKR